MKGGVRFKTNALDDINEEYVETKTTYEKEQDKVVSEIVGIAGKLEALQYYIILFFANCKKIAHKETLHCTKKSKFSYSRTYC